MTSILLFLKAISEGERWITVHPNGNDQPGQPVLIKPAGDGSYHVVAGAGGSLNYLRLRGVRSENSYKQEAKQRAQSKREEAKRQEARDKEAGLTKTRSQALEGARAQLGDARVKLVQKVATALGWKDEDLRFPVEQYGNVTEAARKAAEKKHAVAIMKKVDEAIDYQRKVLVLDAEARHEAGLGEVPLSTVKPDELSVQDLDPIEPASKGLGFAPEYGKRAGITREEATAEAKAIRPPVEPAKAEAAEKRKEIGARIAEELETVRQPAPPLNPTAKVETQKVVEIMKAAKEYRMIASGTRKQVQQIKSAKTKEEMEPKGAVVVEIDSKPTDADVLKDVASDLKTLRTRAFLDQIGTTVAGDNIGRHVAAGAFNAVNSLSLAVAGMGLVDRSVVDVLGVTGAAHALVNRLRRDLSAHELEQLSEAMAAYHQDHYMAASSDALREAVDLHEQAKEIELGAAENTDDLAAMQELNAKRRDMVGQAKRALGTALGEMETNAAIVLALQQGAKAEVPLSMGKTTLEQAIVQLRAIGLNQGDYELDQVSGSALVTIKQSGMDKLAAPIDRADLERVRDSTAITAGLQDEDNYLPGGFADRPDLAMQAKPGVAPRLAKPMDAHAEPTKAIADYVGGRAADGDTPAEIMAGLLSEDTVSRFADRGAYMAAIEALAPLNGPDGKQVRVETYARKFDKLADDYVERTYGADRTSLQKQNFAIDTASIDALHRALADNPDGVAAFKPVGELTPQDEGALRKVFAAEFGRIDPETEALRAKLTKLETQEPSKESDGLFGAGVNPDWTAWRQERDQAAEAVNAAAMDWGKYVKTHGTPQAAYAAMQDVVRSKVLQGFAQTYNTLHPKKPLAIGKQAIANDLAHLDALDPAGRQKRLQDRQQRLTSMRNRVQGQFAAGSVLEKEAAAREAEQGSLQAQMGLFGTTDEAPQQTPAKLGERYSLGHVAEQQIAKMMPSVGANFKPGQKAPIFQPTMSGAYVGRQRAIKLIERNKRMLLGLSTGSGKTAIALGAFTDLKTKGKVKRGTFAVPSVVVGEFQGQALTMLEPGKFKWMADPGASREQRIAAYKGEGGTDFAVVTHQAMRDDFDSLLAAEGMAPSKFDALPSAEQRATAKRLLDKAGWDMQYLAVDEGHNLLNRQGKRNSHLANVMDAISGNTEYYVSATADTVKNDVSEAHDSLRQLEPDRYQDRAAFMRRYGPDTEVAKEGLKREFIGRLYTGQIDPGVQVKRQTVSVPVTPDAGQHEHLDALEAAYGAAQLARARGEVDIPAMKQLAPYAFQGVPAAREAEVAERLSSAMGVVHETAVNRAINDGAKTTRAVEIANERRGKPGVVFCHYLDRVGDLAKRLTAEGHRVGTLTGKDTTKAKDAIKRQFQNGDIDILVASDAGSVGANLQRGQWLMQYDQPMTAMAQPLHSKVLTPTGWRPMGDIAVGDILLCPDGRIAPVSGVFPQGDKDIYRVTFSDGSATECCMDHLWMTKSRDDMLRKRDWRPRTLAHIARTYRLPDGKGSTRANYHIPLVGEIEFASYDMPVAPYVLGVLLGNGNFGKAHVAFSTPDKPVVERVEALLADDAFVSKVGDIDYRIVGDKVGHGYPRRVNNPTLDDTRSLGLHEGRKFIPPQYLFASSADRLALLQGLMDTDGTVDKRNGYTSFCNTNPDILAGVMHLARSLGGVASIGSAKPSYHEGKRGKDHWKVSVSLPTGINPFSQPRKAAVVDERKSRQKMCRTIQTIEPVGRMPAQCIEVAHPDHLYVTDDFVVTHNTHAQRNGRIHRIGQKNNVELIDLVADHPAERRAQARLRDKYELRNIVTSPMDGLDDSGIGGYLNRVKAGKAASEDKTYEKTASDVEPEPPAQTELAA